MKTAALDTLAALDDATEPADQPAMTAFVPSADDAPTSSAAPLATPLSPSGRALDEAVGSDALDGDDAEPDEQASGDTQPDDGDERDERDDAAAPARRGAGGRPAPEIAVGDLVDTGADRMTLHTREAALMFVGRRRDVEAGLTGITGGRRAAGAARAVWLLSATDNPYADWGLLSISASLEAARAGIEEAVAQCDAAIASFKERGLSVSIQRSSKPAELEVGFRSPYGYAIAELITRFDYLVRLVKSMVRKNVFAEQDGRRMIADARRGCRAAFEVAVRFDRVLTKPELKALERSDFLPCDVDEKRTRAAAAVAQFGECPRAVFTGETRPRHTRRRVRLSAAEQALLAQADLSAGGAAAMAA